MRTIYCAAVDIAMVFSIQLANAQLLQAHSQEKLSSLPIKSGLFNLIPMAKTDLG